MLWESEKVKDTPLIALLSGCVFLKSGGGVLDNAPVQFAEKMVIHRFEVSDILTLHRIILMFFYHAMVGKT